MVELVSVLQKTEELAKVLLAKTGEVNAEAKRQELVALDLAKRETAIAARSNSLDAREVEVKKVEDVVGLKARAEAELAEIKGLRRALDREREDFERYRVESMKAVEEARAKVTEEAAMIAKEHEALTKREAVIKKKEEDFIARLMAKLAEMDKK